MGSEITPALNSGSGNKRKVRGEGWGCPCGGDRDTAPRTHTRLRQKPPQRCTGFTPAASNGRTATNPAPKRGAGDGCAEEGMCSREDSSCLCLRLVEEQRAPCSQGSPGGTWDWGFLIWVAVSYVSCLYDKSPGGERLLKFFPVCHFS